MVRDGAARAAEAQSKMKPKIKRMGFSAMNPYPTLPYEGPRETFMIYEDILGTIGNTPIVKIHRSAPPHVTMYVKCEAFNPLSSVKDRLAIAIIEDAEQRGTLNPGQTVVEATSGNTGIALAMVCAVKGYPFVAIMSDSFSVERRKLMRILGVIFNVTPAT